MGTSLPSSVFWFVVGFVLSSALLLAVVVAGVLGLVGAGCSEVGGAVAVIAGSEGERRNGNDDG